MVEKSWFSLSSIICQVQVVMVLSMALHHLSYFFKKARFTTIYLYFICSLREFQYSVTIIFFPINDVDEVDEVDHP